jgi:hypothetical protein
VEQILLLALFLIVALASWLARWLKSRLEARPPAETTPPTGVAGRPRQGRPRDVMLIPTPPTLRDTRPRAPAASVPPRRRPPRPRFGRPSDLRRAIVLMAVLGPCRALERGEASPSGEPTQLADRPPGVNTRR